jgi:hypothetical protein
MLVSGVGYSTEKASVYWDTIYSIRFCCGVGCNGRKTLALWDITEKSTSVISHYGRKTPVLWDTTEKTSSVVSHKRGKPSPLYPTMQERCCVVSHNGKILKT